jgi:hypothetical protein
LLEIIYADPAQDQVMRHYALQFMTSIPSESKHETGAFAAHWAAVQGPNADLAATSLLHLLDAQETGKLNADEKRRLETAAYDLATKKDVGEAALATALPVCGRLGIGKAKKLALRTAQDKNKSYPVRIAAIAALGDLGSQEEIDWLEKISEGREKRLKDPAQAALKKLRAPVKSKSAGNTQSKIRNSCKTVAASHNLQHALQPSASPLSTAPRFFAHSNHPPLYTKIRSDLTPDSANRLAKSVPSSHPAFSQYTTTGRSSLSKVSHNLGKIALNCTKGKFIAPGMCPRLNALALRESTKIAPRSADSFLTSSNPIDLAGVTLSPACRAIPKHAPTAIANKNFSMTPKLNIKFI